MKFTQLMRLGYILNSLGSDESVQMHILARALTARTNKTLKDDENSDQNEVMYPHCKAHMLSKIVTFHNMRYGTLSFTHAIRRTQLTGSNVIHVRISISLTCPIYFASMMCTCIAKSVPLNIIFYMHFFILPDYFLC